MLETELKFLHSNKDNLLQQFGGKFLVIKGEEVGGAYDTMDDALQGAAFAYGVNNVLIRRVSDADLEISIPALTLGLMNADIPNSNSGTGEDSGR
jgi:hypothetical protein